MSQRGFLVVLVLITALTGCASVAPVERYCPGGPQGDVCYMRASPEQVDRHCRRTTVKHDDGTPVLMQDGYRIRCCTTVPMFGRDRVWVARGDEECLAHEECHRWQARQPAPDHSACHGQGWGKDRGK